jgi:hypothetical protein
MHPLRQLFDDINRKHWGIDPHREGMTRDAPSRIRRILVLRRKRAR